MKPGIRTPESGPRGTNPGLRTTSVPEGSDLEGSDLGAPADDETPDPTEQQHNPDKP